MPVYKLTYFALRAVGEPIRQIFAYTGVEYEDIRVTFDQWLALKPNTPFGQLPFLEIDGKPLPQSYAIARYLASQHGLAGKTPFEAAWVDALADQYKDYMSDFRTFWYLHMGYREGNAEEKKKEFGEGARDKFYPLIAKQLKENGRGFLVGDAVTWVDFLISEHVATVVEYLPGFLDAYPEVLAHSKKIREIPQIKKWIETRPESRG